MHARVRSVPKSRVQYGSISLIAVQKKWFFSCSVQNFLDAIDGRMCDLTVNYDVHIEFVGRII